MCPQVTGHSCVGAAYLQGTWGMGHLSRKNCESEPQQANISLCYPRICHPALCPFCPSSRRDPGAQEGDSVPFPLGDTLQEHWQGVAEGKEEGGREKEKGEGGRGKVVKRESAVGSTLELTSACHQVLVLAGVARPKGLPRSHLPTQPIVSTHGLG